MTNVLYGLKHSQNLGKQFIIHRSLCPLGPVVDNIRIRTAGDCGRNVFLCHAKLHG